VLEWFNQIRRSWNKLDAAPGVREARASKWKGTSSRNPCRRYFEEWFPFEDHEVKDFCYGKDF